MTRVADWIDQMLAALAAGSPRRVTLLLVCLSLITFLPGFAGLPSLDRDEPRFAQATKQMLTSDDYVDIRFQDGPRYKKPVGIYWLQSAAVAVVGQPGDTAIWTYRLPSLLAAILSVVFTAGIAARFGGQAAGLSAGLLLLGTFLLGAEARLATTDACLLAAILASQSVVAGLYRKSGATGFEPGRTAPVSLSGFLLFWGALAATVLLKGPIGLMVVGATIAVLAALHRSTGWLRHLRPVAGIALLLGLVLPWYIAITLRSGMAFWDEALGRDLLSKIGSAQERHGAPPGSYVAALWLMFFPASVALLAALPAFWRNRRLPGLVFALAWVVPGWLIFELTATKLVHYVLPFYPALAIAVALVWPWVATRPLPRWTWWGISVICILPLAVLTGIAGFAVLRGEPPPVALFAGGLVLTGGLWFALGAFRRGLIHAPLIGLWAAGLGLAIGVFPGVAAIAAIWPSSGIIAISLPTAACPVRPIFAEGYGEPSLVFLSPAPVAWVGAEGAAEAIAADPCGIAVVSAPARTAFLARASQLAVTPAQLGLVSGLNLGNGREVTLLVFGMPPK